MNKTLSRVLTALSGLVLLYALASALVLFEQLASLAERLQAGSGAWVLGGLIALSALLVVYLLWLFWRLPKAMQPPREAAELPAYHAWLQGQWQRHPDAVVREHAQRGDVAAARAHLQQQAQTLTQQVAGGVFISTALIQNGRLDGLVLLASQIRLVWRVAQIYHLRPTPRQLGGLYANVAGSVLVSSSLQELDFAEIVGPVIGAAAPAMAGAVPGLQGVSNLLANSLATGASNAFMTLRIGLLAQAYCAPLLAVDTATTRQQVTLQAAVLLKSIVAEQGKRVVRSVWAAAGQVVSSTVGAATDGIWRATSASTQAVGQSIGQAMDSTGQLLRRSGDALAEGVQESSDAVSRTLQKTRLRWRKAGDDAPPPPADERS